MEKLNQKINRLNVLNFEAAAISGKGVFETLTMICRLVLKAIEEGAGAGNFSEKAEPVSEKPSSFTPALGKTVKSAESSKNGQGLFLAGELREERRVSPVQASPLMKEETLDKEIKPPKGNGSSQQTFFTRVSEIRGAPEIMIPPKEEEKRRISHGSFLGRMFAKIAAGPLVKETEGPQRMIPPSQGEMRIISCAEPQILPPGRLRIPLRIEIDGLAKGFPINLVINLENAEPKGE
jgi:hypothetical protein